MIGFKIYTNWYRILEDGTEVFNHQSVLSEDGDKPAVVNDQYGLQACWEEMNWTKKYTAVLAFK